MRTEPYGAWESPISPELVVQGARRLGELRVDGAGLWWLEQRPDEGGRTAIVRRDPDGTVADVTPEEANVRTRVHEYGGGAYAVDDGTCWYTEFEDQRIHRLDPGGAPRPITPEPSEPAALRYADLTPTADRRHLLCVRERHHGPAATDVVNELVAVPADGQGAPTRLAGGHDFVAAPRPSPDGRHLAWVGWDHPSMPWDETTLWVARLEGTAVSRPAAVAGGHGSGESVILPTWAPDGALHFMSDRSGWWNLHRVEDPDAAADRQPQNLAPVADDLALPPWQFGQTPAAFLDDGRIAVVRIEDAVERPALLDPAAGTVTPLPVAHTVCRSLATDGRRLWYVGASPRLFEEIVEVDVAASTCEPRSVHRSRDLPVDPDWLPEPESVWLPTGDGERTQAFVYPPTSPTHRGPEGERPPAIVTSHGGPTGHSPPSLSLSTAFWTSRGFAVADVNYRGSTGFGRAYRDALKGRWGLADVDDCASSARFLAERGDADPTRLAIRGGSASGYTTLCALTFTDTFAAGASHFGVADPALLAEETHKFESRYLDGLIAPFPERRDVYDARSPLQHAGQASCPIILLQGLEDLVVPPSQAEAMVAALAERGIPHAYVAFPDEQHGFRKAENQIAALEAELSFYLQVFGLEHPPDLPRVSLRGA
ncbi:S9 family peptidase [Egibacter rhizosphaerae]|uniref:S9 family peptidase n=1 Tax=Egibacter rhizosphaerae TaxID=1670831 RepID=A0A411YFE4_9ACTN|nr:S9 family peptidase [Egibacter rhizosphaerae]QBI19827.1 S9 family peptidase [Egibacter rhizosphaerae]